MSTTATSLQRAAEAATERLEMLTRPQAAEYIGCRPQTLAVWALTGRYSLPMVKVGRCVRYRKSDLDRWLASRTVGEVPQ